MPISVPRHSGQIPVYYNHKFTHHWFPYATGKSSPLYEFGYGLSYTTFEYGDMEVTPADDGWQVSFTVKNTGRRAGTETAQVYAGACGSEVPRPVRELKGYERVTLLPGEVKRVSVRLDRSAFSYYDMNLRDFRIEAGAYRIEAGSSSRDLKLSQTLNID